MKAEKQILVTELHLIYAIEFDEQNIGEIKYYEV